MTWDELKQHRDGHLYYGRKDALIVRAVHRVVEVTATAIFTTLGDGRGVVEWRRAP